MSPTHSILYWVYTKCDSVGSGRKALADANGIQILYDSAQEVIDCREMESLILLASVIMRKCCPRNKLPLDKLQSPFNLELPESELYPTGQGVYQERSRSNSVTVSLFRKNKFMSGSLLAILDLLYCFCVRSSTICDDSSWVSFLWELDVSKQNSLPHTFWSRVAVFERKYHANIIWIVWQMESMTRDTTVTHQTATTAHWRRTTTLTRMTSDSRPRTTRKRWNS